MARRAPSSRCTSTASAPRSSGRCPSGVASVLSTASRPPAAWAAPATAAMSQTSSPGLEGVSIHTSVAPVAGGDDRLGVGRHEPHLDAARREPVGRHAAHARVAVAHRDQHVARPRAPARAPRRAPPCRRRTARSRRPRARRAPPRRPTRSGCRRARSRTARRPASPRRWNGAASTGPGSSGAPCSAAGRPAWTARVEGPRATTALCARRLRAAALSSRARPRARPVERGSARSGTTAAHVASALRRARLPRSRRARGSSRPALGEHAPRRRPRSRTRTRRRGQPHASRCRPARGHVRVAAAPPRLERRSRRASACGGRRVATTLPPAVRRIAATTLLLSLALAAPAGGRAAAAAGARDVAAARAWAAQRAGDVSFAVRTERRAWSWRGDDAVPLGERRQGDAARRLPAARRTCAAARCGPPSARCWTR